MKLFFTLIAVFTFLFALGCAETGKDIQKEEAFQGPPLYTAYNIWRLRNLWLMRCINYK
jgi:ABC-type Zn uptake system ZnuABC Zn-binding protein ZnuA